MKPTFALIGLPTDRHSSYLRGPAKGPAFIRAALACDGTTAASEDGRELGLDLIINDCGDAPLREADGSTTHCSPPENSTASMVRTT